MAEENGDHKNFDKRIERTEEGLINLAREVAHHGQQLSSIQTSLDAGLQQLSHQVSALFNKTDRPTPWGVIFTGIGVLVMLVSLALAPLYSGLEDGKFEHKQANDHRVDDAYMMGQIQKDIEWLKLMEDRLNNRLHEKP